MTYEINVERRARKELTNLPKQDQVRGGIAIDALGDNPRPAGCQPIRRAPKGTYRIRVGDHRVIYIILDHEQEVIVVRVAKRGEHTYKDLG